VFRVLREGKRPLGRPRCMWELGSKIDLKAGVQKLSKNLGATLKF
jgi:hypothetical protein